MISGSFPTRADFSAMVRLAVPVVVVQVGMMLMGVVDAMVIGHVSSQALAAVAMGNLYFWGLVVVGLGVLLAIDPLVSHAVGAGDDETVAVATQRGLIVAVGLTMVLSLLMLPVEPVLRALHQPEDVVIAAALYTRIMIPSVLPFLAFVVLRTVLQARSRLAPIVLAVVAANVINAALNWLLVFGKLGLPVMGVAGSAWATCLSRWLLLALLLLMAWRDLRPTLWPIRPGLVAVAAMRQILWIGVPIGVQMWLEYGAFAAIMVMMGRLGTAEIAAHQIALNLASLTFMVPLGIAQATAVQVGNAIGAEDQPRARRAASAGLLGGAAFMVCSAALFLSMPRLLALMYLSAGRAEDEKVIALASLLIPIAGLFQVFDGLQTVAAGVLRGVGDTRVPLLVNLLGFWLIGLPASAWMAFGHGAGAVGLWWGFVAGLGVVSGLLLWRVRVRLGREMVRLHVSRAVEATE